MFSKYKGIEIPLNYSGSRFKSSGVETEMKTHKPSPSYRSTKTSVSPTFQSVINQAVNDSYAQETVPDVYEMSDDLNEMQKSSEAPLVVIDNNESNEQSSENEDEKKKGLSSIFDELKPFFEKLKSSIKGEDLLLISLIILLASEGGNDSLESILPLLLLFLYN